MLKETCIPYDSELELPSTSGYRQLVMHVHLPLPPDKSNITSLPANYATSLWNKVEALLNTPNRVCNAPGMEDVKSVASA